MPPAANPLAVAKRLAAGRFAGWTYGSSVPQRRIDCVQFVLAVVEEVLAQSLNPLTRSQILIANLTAAESGLLPTLIGSEHKKIKGVQQALMAIGRGTAVQPKDARAGDLIQYWMKKSDGTWFGHAAVLETVEKSGANYRAPIFGAHAGRNGIATSSYKLRLSGGDRKVFLVRMV